LYNKEIEEGCLKMDKKRSLMAAFAVAAATIATVSTMQVVVKRRKRLFTSIALTLLSTIVEESFEDDELSSDHFGFLLVPEHEPPLYPLKRKDVLEDILHDGPRRYMKFLAGLHGWEFFHLLQETEELIARPRNGGDPNHKGKKCKHDPAHRLYFALNWLHTAKEFNTITYLFIKWKRLIKMKVKCTRRCNVKA